MKVIDIYGLVAGILMLIHNFIFIKIDFKSNEFKKLKRSGYACFALATIIYTIEIAMNIFNVIEQGQFYNGPLAIFWIIIAIVDYVTICIIKSKQEKFILEQKNSEEKR